MIPSMGNFIGKVFMNLPFCWKLALKTTTVSLGTKKKVMCQGYLFAEIFFASFAYCLPKCENSFTRKFLPLKYHCTGEQDK